MRLLACLTLALLGQGLSHAEEKEARITDRNVNIFGFVDVGQVGKGSLVDGLGLRKPASLDGAFLNRDGIALTYSGTLNERVRMKIGVGGLFWKAIPESQEESSKRIQFGPGISEATAQYDFTDHLSLKFGFMGYKYNPDASNLGEYLLRSEAYPSILHTAGPGGWVWMNSAEYKSMGAKLTWETFDGALRQDLLLFSEFNESPIFDFSPSYVATLRAGSAFEFGAGFSLHRWLPIHPSITTPSSDMNAAVTFNSFPEIQGHAKVVFQDQTGKLDTAFATWRGSAGFDQGAFLAADPNRKAVQAVIPDQTGSSAGSREGMLSQMRTSLTYCSDQTEDSCTKKYLTAEGDQALAIDPATGAPLQNAAGTDSLVTLLPSTRKQLTFKAVKVMARASMDLGQFFDVAEKTGPFKLFAEAAVLGVENQPVFYTDVMQRIPVMIGADIPTFGILSLLSLQMEYFRNDYADNNYKQYQDAFPQPQLPNENPARYQYLKDLGEYKKDDVKWSVLMQKTLVQGLDLYLQVANDHFRVQNIFAEPSFIPVTSEKSDWYYLLRFQWSM